MKEGTLYSSFSILISDPIDNTVINKLIQKGFQVNYNPTITRNEILEIIENYDILIVRSRTKVDKEVIERGKRLKIIARAGVGLDNIDVDEAVKRGIKVIYAPGASTDSVAELTIGLMIIAARNLYNSITFTKNGIFKKVEGFELKNKILGIVGLGRIGTRVAQIAKALGMRIVAYDIIDVSSKARELEISITNSLDELLSISDIISLHASVTNKKSIPIISEREFKIMKDGVIIINTSRASLIDGKALLRYLELGKVGFYAADVMWNEPPKEDWELKIISHDRVIITPHIGAQTKEAQKRIGEAIFENIIKAVEEIRNVIINTGSS
ncbi:MAG: D-2-hydroxyacid dehydrogenase [Sulfolobaceae archaeon]